MTIKIEFPTDEQSVTELREVLEIDEVSMRFNFFVDGESVMDELTPAEYFGDLFYMFLLVCLQMLPDLDKGGSSRFTFTGSGTELRFDSDGETVTTYLHTDHGKASGDRYEMDLQGFAREVIQTSEEFLEFALELRPDERDNWTVKELETEIRDAKVWYLQTYDQDCNALSG